MSRTFSSAFVNNKKIGKPNGKNLYIASIGVKKDFRGKGIGSKILSFVFENAKQIGANKIWLKVGKDNVPAIKLFQKTGFKSVYDKNNFLVMSRCIEN